MCLLSDKFKVVFGNKWKYMKTNNIKVVQVFLLIIFTILIIFVNNFFIVVHAQETNEIHILSFNTLMAFPDKALNPKNKLSAKFDEEKITPKEFEKILQFLYLKNYCLVSIYDLINPNELSINPRPTNFPNDKIPLILTFDNVSYKSNYQNHGEVDKIIIDRKGNFATYTTKKSIQDRIQYDNEFLVILENFVDKYPDFSFRGAKGIIFLSGENGILGYNTNTKSANSKYEIERATEVVTMLKRKGWTFGSNNYKYIIDSNKSEIEFKKELMLWQNEVASIVGETPLYSCPKGYLDSTKLSELKSNNYKIILHNILESTPKISNSQIILPTKKINGQTLRNNSIDLEQYFDCKSVYDTEHRIKSYS